MSKVENDKNTQIREDRRKRLNVRRTSARHESAEEIADSLVANGYIRTVSLLAASEGEKRARELIDEFLQTCLVEIDDSAPTDREPPVISQQLESAVAHVYTLVDLLERELNRVVRFNRPMVTPAINKLIRMARAYQEWRSPLDLGREPPLDDEDTLGERK